MTGEYSYILEQQGKTTAEKLADFADTLGWRDELGAYRMEMANYEMQVAAQEAEIAEAKQLQQELAATFGLDASRLAEQAETVDILTAPYTEAEIAALDAESAAYYEAFAANYVATAAFPGGGSGTAADPYIITNRAQLEAMADGLTAYYQLGNNIDLGGSAGGIEWIGIGSISTPFTGTLDGDGHVISNLYIRTSRGNNGLFAYTLNSNIRKLGVENVDIVISTSNSHEYTAGFIAQGSGYISECYVTVDRMQSTSTGRSWNGVAAMARVGTNNVRLYVSDCYTSGNTISASGSNAPVSYGAIAAETGSLPGGGSVINVYTNIDTLSTDARSMYGGISGIASISSGGTSGQISKCVGLGNNLVGQYAYRVGGNLGATLDNNYANSAMLVNGAVVSSGTTTNEMGANVNAATYHTQAFWETTLGWDFTNTWYWDTVEQLPKLQAFLHGPTITSVSANPTTGGITTEITMAATVIDATSMQWQYSTDGGAWTNIPGATAATATWTPGAPGSYEVRLQATNNDGTTTSDTVSVIIYAAPTVTATVSPTAGPVQQMLTLTGSVTDPAPGTTAYQWQSAPAETGEWTDIAGATALTYQYSYDGAPGTTWYRMAATGVGGTAYSTAVSYTAYDAPTAVATVTPASGVVPLQISYSVDTTGDVQSYQWEVNVDGGGWQQIGTAASGTYTADTAGTYQFRVIVSGYGGLATSNTESVDATNEIIPVVTPASPYYAVRNTPVQFSVSDYDTSVEPTWTFGDSGTATGASVSHTYTTSDTYTATVTVKQLITGETMQISVTVYVGDPPSSVDLTVPSRATYGQQVSMSATASGGAVDTWSWTFGDDTTGNGPAVTHTYSAGSSSVVTYTVSATATNNYGSATASTQIQVAIPFDASILSPLANSKTQLGTPINYLAAQPTDELAHYITYTFDTGTGYTGNIAEFEYTPQTTGTFIATLTVDNGHGYTNSKSVSYEVGDAPVITITAPSPNTSVVAGKPITFSASVTGADTATWDFGDDTDTSTGLTVTHTYAYSVGDSVTVSATATNAYGSVSATITLTVRHAPFRWESALGQELLFIDDYCVLWTGVDGLSGIPASGIATTNADIIGELFQRTTFGSRTITLDVMIHGSDAADVEAKRESLISVLMPYYGLGKLYYRMFDGTEWYLNCMVQNGYPRFVNGPLGTGWSCEIGFVAYDPCWYSVDVVSLTGDGTITNHGDLPCGGIIVLGSEGATNETTNESIVPTESYDLTGITVSTVDGNKYAKDSEGNNVLYRIGVDSVFISFAPGQNVISGAQSVTIRPRRGGI